MAGPIIAMGGGGFSMEPDNPLLDLFVLSAARDDNPRICFVPTASGDSQQYVAKFYRAFAPLRCRPVDLQLFERSVQDLAGFIAEQDIVYVGGGSTANLLAIWRTHGLDEALETAWRNGTVLCGISAGMNCWFEGSVTDSFDVAALAPLDDGLGLLPGSACPHYDGEPQRRPTYLELVQTGASPGGYAADDGTALVFANGELREVVASRPAAREYRVTRGETSAVETVLDTRFLG